MLRSILAFITHGGHYKSILTYMTSHDSDDGAGFGQTVTRGCSIVGGPEMNCYWAQYWALATGHNTGHRQTAGHITGHNTAQRHSAGQLLTMHNGRVRKGSYHALRASFSLNREADEENAFIKNKHATTTVNQKTFDAHC